MYSILHFSYEARKSSKDSALKTPIPSDYYEVYWLQGRLSR